MGKSFFKILKKENPILVFGTITVTIVQFIKLGFRE